MNLQELKPGDLIRHKHSADAYVVIHRGSETIAVRATSVSNPSEWEECLPPAFSADRFFRLFELKLIAHNFNAMLAASFITSLRNLYEEPTMTNLIRLAKAALSSVG
jgi:hypothetical protein